MSRLSQGAFVAFQRLIPQHGLSRLFGMLAKSEQRWLSRLMIRAFSSVYDVDLDEAARPNVDGYRSFNDFFTRELKADARPLAPGERMAICPADGVISQAGEIRAGQLLQAKGHTYSLEALLGEPPEATAFEGGCFATVYLAPHNYHRVHLPVDGKLIRTRAIPGTLYSVNQVTETHIDGLFARNERLVCFFDTPFGEMAVVLVGAMIVASIETVWVSPVSPYTEIRTTEFRTDVRAQAQAQARDHEYQRGAEIGRFLLGSTVIVCMQPGRARLDDGLQPGSARLMGQPLFTLR